MERRRLRFDNLVPARNQPLPEEARRRSIVRGLGAAPPRPAGAVADASVQPLVRKTPRDLSLRDWAIYLLSNASEVEHALLVQYLYAAYSLNPDASGPAANDPGATVSTSAWAETIMRIAVEEMGHLITIQNILRFVGGPISFEREDFPLRTEVYPFPFQLERLTKDSLAKYVYAEMPEGDIEPKFVAPAEKQEIEDRAMRAAGVKKGNFVNHVGTLYATLLDVFRSEEFQDPARNGFPPDTARYQAVAISPWERTLGNASIHPPPGPGGEPPPPVNLRRPRVLSVSSITDVLDALDFIASQGERSDKDRPEESHFGRFLKVYREFPDEGAPGWPVPPAFPVSTNPTATPAPVTPGTILHPITQLWARLFDLRYRMLLVSLAHVTAIPANDTSGSWPGTQGPTRATTLLVTWVYDLMKFKACNIRDLATTLARMPLADSAGAPAAGPPFGMPYTLAIPDREHERWQYHLDVLASCEALTAVLNDAAVDDPRFPIFAEARVKLAGLIADEAQRRAEIEQILKGF